MNNWLAIGPADNWKLGLDGKVWGFAVRHGKAWARINPGDRLFFYATAPVKGIIGYGTVRRTFQGRSPFWPEEKKRGEILWPFRVEFSVERALPGKDWETKRLELDRRGVVFQRALQPLDAGKAGRLLKSLAKL